MREKPSLLSGVKWFLYDVKVKLFGRFERNKKPKAYNKKLGQNVFLFFFLLFPVGELNDEEKNVVDKSVRARLYALRVGFRLGGVRA